MMVKRKANLDDGCNPELVAGAVFDGELEIPVIHAPAEIVIPSGITPFSKREKAIGTDEAVGFFEKTLYFQRFLLIPHLMLKISEGSAFCCRLIVLSIGTHHWLFR